jgi:hypothetical protein
MKRQLAPEERELVELVEQLAPTFTRKLRSGELYPPAPSGPRLLVAMRARRVSVWLMAAAVRWQSPVLLRLAKRRTILPGRPLGGL